MPESAWNNSVSVCKQLNHIVRVHIQEGSAAAILPDEWFHSWNAQNISMTLRTCSFPVGFTPHSSFSPAVWCFMPGTFYGITPKASLCSLLVYASRPLLQRHLRNVRIPTLFSFVVRFTQSLCPISCFIILSNHNRMLGKSEVLLMKLE